MQEGVSQALESIGSLAGSIHKKMSVFLLIALIMLAALAFDLYSSQAYLWWNLLLIGFVFLPFLVWLFIWSVIGQLREAPEHAAALLHNKESFLSNFRETDAAKPKGFKGLLSTVNKIRKHEGLGSVFDAVSGIGILCNPVFLLLSLVFFLMLLALMAVTPVILFI